ncbi:hypothetical protein BASA81_004156 [Batrachochytrium salamandrivorans]|nr:hypothetical protein BASA81_004156 [Batrachochytrium salamandrivorans]
MNKLLGRVIESEEERILKEVRRENKFCFLCKERGPAYVDVDHSIFVCTFCSGLLREFSFKIKSTSLSTFSLNEVKQLRSFSNTEAKQFWLQRFRGSHPNPGETETLRQFIRATFVENRWLEDAATSSSFNSDFTPLPPSSKPPPKPQAYDPPMFRAQQLPIPSSQIANDDEFGDFSFTAVAASQNSPSNMGATDEDFDEFVSGSLSRNPFTMSQQTGLIITPRPGKNLFEGFY